MNARPVGPVDENKPLTAEEQDKQTLGALIDLMGKIDGGINDEEFADLKANMMEHLTTEDLMELLGNEFVEAVAHRQIVDVPCQLLSLSAMPPEYANTSDACADLFADEDVTIMPGETYAVKTGFALAIPEGYVCHVYPRSGISKKTGVRIANSVGVIDAGYRDEVKVLLWNTGKEPYTVTKGMRIAQMDIMPSPAMEFVPVDNVKEYGEDRGGGFGSTGLTAIESTENGKV